ncbi:threonine/serine exporter ThrE family protein [Kitasatospora sp. NPDC101176]|uniref:threonine/serine ThrE exporter family protein n=1 Tax=Kitasatospora sp. NPDC101176 TaxID=3364099 RepID=UPI00381680B4
MDRPTGTHQELAGFLTRLTEVLLGVSGEGAEQVERTVRRAARDCGGSAALLVVPDGATVTVTSHGRTTTAGVRAFPEVFRLDRVVALDPLLAEVSAGRIGAAEADRRLAAIADAPQPYPWWLRMLGIVLFSVGFAPLMQATWYEVWTTAVLATVSAGLAVGAERVPRLAVLLPPVAAVAVSVIALEAFAGTPAHGGPVLLMLPALFYFVPGDYLSAAAAELAAGYLTTGAIRLVYAVFLLLQLYVGVLLGLVFTGTPRHSLFDVAAHGDLPRWMLFLSWVVFTVGTVLSFAVPWRLLPALLVLVYLTVGVQSVGTWLFGEFGGTFVAAVALGAAAGLLSRRPGMPPRLVLALPGFFTLTVGSLGLRGLTDLAGGHPIEGFRDITKLVTILTVIAVGLLAGAVIAELPSGRSSAPPAGPSPAPSAGTPVAAPAPPAAEPPDHRSGPW